MLWAKATRQEDHGRASSSEPRFLLEQSSEAAHVDGGQCAATCPSFRVERYFENIPIGLGPRRLDSRWPAAPEAGRLCPQPAGHPPGGYPQPLGEPEAPAPSWAGSATLPRPCCVQQPVPGLAASCLSVHLRGPFSPLVYPLPLLPLLTPATPPLHSCSPCPQLVPRVLSLAPMLPCLADWGGVACGGLGGQS